jgi:hypothetical protein
MSSFQSSDDASDRPFLFSKPSKKRKHCPQLKFRPAFAEPQTVEPSAVIGAGRMTKMLCPQCRKVLDSTVPSCDGCDFIFFKKPSAPKDLTKLCVGIAGGAFLVAIVIAALVLH